jgi:ankyrin repeat protein
MSKIHDAAARGDVETIKGLLKGSFLRRARPELVNEPDSKLYMCEPAAVAPFLPVNLWGRGWTPLHVASAMGHKNVVDFLLANGADAKVRDDGLRYPLEIAVLTCHWDIAEALLCAWTFPDLKNFTNYGDTLLHWCIRAEQIDGVRILLSKGASLDVKDNNRETPLELAQRSVNTEIRALVLKHRESAPKEGNTSHEQAA